MPITRAGVIVNTWGTQSCAAPGIGTGLSKVTESVVCGRNVGHASLLLALPDTDENRKLVDYYLGGTDIPVEYKVYQTKKIEYRKGMPPVLTDENVYEEKLIEVYFSWWPGNEDEGYSFKTFLKDCELEREGLNFDYDPRWANYLNPTIAESSGKIGKWLNPTITLGPGLITHEKTCSPLELEVLRTYQHAYKTREKIKSVMLLFHKLNERKEKNESPFTIMPEEVLIAKNLFPGKSWDKMNSKKFLAILEKNIKTTFNKNLICIYRYAQALDKLDGRQALNELDAEIETYEKRIENLEVLWEKLENINIVLASKEEIETLNTLLMKDSDLKKRFPNGVNGGNFHAIKEEVEFELDSEEIDSLAFEFQKLMDKKELLRNFYYCVDNIENVRSVLKKISEYESTDDLKLVLNSENVDEKIKELKLLIKPGKGELFKEFGQLINSGQFDIISFLEERSAPGLFEKTKSQGKQPDHTVRLRLKREGVEGLDAEKMLQKMAEFTHEGDKFNLVNKNCAIASSEILASGAGKNAGIFEERALKVTVTPQMIYHNAVKYSDLIDATVQRKLLRFSAQQQSDQKAALKRKPMPYKARLW